MDIRGNWATLLLPLNDQEIVWEALKTQIEHYIDVGVDGIYSNGTTGEFYTQSSGEFKRINQLLAQECSKAGMPFQVGASHCHPQDALERVQFAASLQPTAIQVILPNWFPCTLETALTFLKRAEETAQGVPLVLYNPPHAKVVLNAQELRCVYDQVPSLVGFKLPRLTPEIIATDLQNDASIFVAGHFLATDALKGASGAYSNVCCLGPATAQRWTSQCLAMEPEALELEARIQRFLADCIAPYIERHGYCNAAADKFMACLGGWAPMTPEMRFPFKGIPASELGIVRELMKDHIPEFVQDPQK